ncbi:MAG: carbon-nitrogen family hydrolase [Melioribacteraceae bacterium]
MKIAICQFSPSWNDKDESILTIEKLISNLEKGTDVLIFPEMTLTGFTMNAKENAEEIDGIGISYFLKLARRKKLEIFAGIIEKENAKYYNSLFHFNSWGIIQAVYRKIHPFSLAKENENYSAGNEIVVSTINELKIGLSICYDLRFPELYRLCTKQGAEILISIANWPIKRIEHWKTLLKARAIENQCFVIGANRIGTDPNFEYNGCSAVFNPMGEELVIVENEEKIIYCEINLDEVKNIREKLPFLNDMKLI